MKKVLWAVAAAAVVFSGCANSRRVKVESTEELPYRVGREDVLDVSVWRDGDLSRTVPVRPDGFISLPMVGELKAEGQTPQELEKQIRERLSPYVQDPKVTVIVREVNSRRIYVTGEVARPGMYPLRGRVSVVQAIALAGGFSDFANQDGIVVLRNEQSGKQIPVRYSELLSSGEGDDVMRDFALLPGDTVVVP